MSKPVNRTRVQRAFSLASASYDQHAALQREIGNRLIAHMEFAKIRPRRILDIGCGTGFLTRLLRARFRRAEIIALDLSHAMTRTAKQASARRLPWQGRTRFVTADACALPLGNETCDLVCSNLVMQWVPEPMRMMREMRRVLAPGGLMLFSTFGRRTLSELRQSLATVAPNHRGVLPFADIMELGDALAALPVELPVTDADLFTLTYPDTRALLRELKSLGASASAIDKRRGGLYGRRLIRDLEHHYARHHSTPDGRVRATFEALYAQAWYKSDPGFMNDRVIPIRAT